MTHLETLLVEILVPIVIAFVASSGFWVFMEKIRAPKSAQTELLIGLAHDRITYLCGKFIKRGWITQDEYENLEKYLYCPYKKLGGNGTVERLLEEIDKLPIRQPNNQ